jgi:hypothetical protein
MYISKKSNFSLLCIGAAIGEIDLCKLLLKHGAKLIAEAPILEPEPEVSRELDIHMHI